MPRRRLLPRSTSPHKPQHRCSPPLNHSLLSSSRRFLNYAPLWAKWPDYDRVSGVLERVGGGTTKRAPAAIFFAKRIGR